MDERIMYLLFLLLLYLLFLRQKWARMHMIRIVMAYDLPLPDRLFTPSRTKGRFTEIFSKNAYQALLSILSQRSTFTLVKDFVYVKIVYK